MSYDFCSFSHIWGWASWRRVWRDYDVNFSYWEEAKKDKNKRKSLFINMREEIYFSSFISDTLRKENGKDTWDVQLLYMLRAQNRLSVYPSVNLVTNIGLSSESATHTNKPSRKTRRAFVEAQTISFPLQHPQYMLSNKKINATTFRKNFFSYKRLLRYFLKLY
ncbi:MAG: hypothetical protein LBD21_04470 [Tannerellaceae bacterium]|nr:hypothetical protein [Tannerellaceae bacterium]